MTTKKSVQLQFTYGNTYVNLYKLFCILMKVFLNLFKLQVHLVYYVKETGIQVEKGKTYSLKDESKHLYSGQLL
jgi:hypothetical protein